MTNPESGHGLRLRAHVNSEVFVPFCGARIAVMKARIANSADADSRARTGQVPQRYAGRILAFLPRLRKVGAQ